MNDGIEWRELRNWTMRNLKNIGFAKQKMETLLLDELALILRKLKQDNVHRIKLAFETAVTNVLWKLLAGQPVDAKLQYISSCKSWYLATCKKRKSNVDAVLLTPAIKKVDQRNKEINYLVESFAFSAFSMRRNLRTEPMRPRSMSLSWHGFCVYLRVPS